MHVYSIDQYLEVSPGVNVTKKGNSFFIDFCDKFSKIIKDLREADIIDGKIMALFPIKNFQTKQISFNRCFAKEMSGVILFLEHLHFVKSRTILGRRDWIQSTKDLGGECGFLVLCFGSTGVIAVQIEGEVFLFGQEHAGISCSMSTAEFAVYQQRSAREEKPRESLAQEVNWLLMEETQRRESSPEEGTMAPLLKKALGK